AVPENDILNYEGPRTDNANLNYAATASSSSRSGSSTADFVPTTIQMVPTSDLLTELAIEVDPGSFDLTVLSISAGFAVLSGCLPVGTCLLDWLRESQKIEFLEWVQCDCVDADTPAKMGHVVLQLPSMASSGIVYSTTVCYDPPVNSPSDAEPSAESQPLRL
ncbi:unnamed protein product, partial [Polarella glacialis]